MQALGNIRYADDFVLTHVKKDLLVECIAETQKGLLTSDLIIEYESLTLKSLKSVMEGMASIFWASRLSKNNIKER
jgi:hypothetical protein